MKVAQKVINTPMTIERSQFFPDVFLNPKSEKEVFKFLDTKSEYLTYLTFSYTTRIQMASEIGTIACCLSHRYELAGQRQ